MAASSAACLSPQAISRTTQCGCRFESRLNKQRSCLFTQAKPYILLAGSSVGRTLQRTTTPSEKLLSWRSGHSFSERATPKKSLAGRISAVGQSTSDQAVVESERRTDGPQGKPGLPPGSTGLPVVGETFAYLKTQNTEDPGSFFRERQAKYGNMFQSNFLGNDTIFVTGPEAAELLLTNERMFRTEWPTSTRSLLGENSLAVSQGIKHKYLRGLMVAPLSLDNLKRFVPLVERVVLTQIGSWKNNSTVAAYDAMRRMTFDIISELMFGAKPGPQQDRISALFKIWLGGLFSLVAVRLPFTAFGAAMTAREELLKETSTILKERRAAIAEGRPLPNDVLSRLMLEKGPDGVQMTDEDLQDNLLTLLFAGHDTSASGLARIVRCLSENPPVVQKLREEHAAIRKDKKDGEPLTWEDVRHMSYTEKVISEGLRVAPVVANAFKVANQDIVFNGYLIPEGHHVTLNYRAMMCSDNFFPDAKAFKPERFDDKPAPYTYLPFATGERQCPGSALARMEMAVFLYHFVDKIDWTLVNPSEATSYFPLPQPVEGLPIRVHKRAPSA